MKPRCDNCGIAALVPHQPDGIELRGAISIGRVTLCCDCVREAVALAARVSRRLIELSPPTAPK